ncbi:hypothetical protein JNK13_02360 [bacterium]|nr:hypothetical protein [bacterium]
MAKKRLIIAISSRRPGYYNPGRHTIEIKLIFKKCGNVEGVSYRFLNGRSLEEARDELVTVLLGTLEKFLNDPRNNFQELNNGRKKGTDDEAKIYHISQHVRAGRFSYDLMVRYPGGGALLENSPLTQLIFNVFSTDRRVTNFLDGHITKVLGTAIVISRDHYWKDLSGESIKVI